MVKYYNLIYKLCKNNKNTLIIQYEDMRKDTLKEMKRVYTFFGIPVDEKRINEVTEECKFDKMKKEEKKKLNIKDEKKSHMRK